MGQPVQGSCADGRRVVSGVAQDRLQRRVEIPGTTGIDGFDKALHAEELAVVVLGFCGVLRLGPGRGQVTGTSAVCCGLGVST